MTRNMSVEASAVGHDAIEPLVGIPSVLEPGSGIEVGGEKYGAVVRKESGASDDQGVLL